MHAVNVFRAGLDPDQDHRFARPGAFFRLIGIEHHRSAGRAGRCRQAARDDVPVGIRVQRRVQQLIQRRRFNPGHRGAAVDQAFIRHVHGNLHRRRRRALAATGLQHPQLAALHGEFDVLHVLVVIFQPLADRIEFAVNLGHDLFHRRQGRSGLFLAANGQPLRRANTGNDILALGIDEVFPVEAVFAGRRVPREGNTGGAIIAHITEHHGLHIDRRAPFFGNFIEPPVSDRARRLPAAEHRADGAPELFFGIVREGRTGFLHDLGLEGRDQRFQIIRRQFRIQRDAAIFLRVFEQVFEMVVIDAQHDIAIHLDEPAVAVIGEAAVIAARRQPFDRHIVQPQVQNRVHHARHRHPGPGPHRNQQRVVRIAEARANRILDLFQRRRDLALQVIGIGFPIVVVMGA